MLKIGLTGGIGSGKTTVANLFATLDVPIIDADEISHALVQPGTPGYHSIVLKFGEGILKKSKSKNENPELDRTKLRHLIFSQINAKKQLESILHPLIRQEISNNIGMLTTPYCIIVIPLLFETDQSSLVDRILVIDTDSESQIIRTQKRDGDSRDQVKAIIAQQINRKTRRSLADDLIVNVYNVENLNGAVYTLHQKYLSLVATNWNK